MRIDGISWIYESSLRLKEAAQTVRQAVSQVYDEGRHASDTYFSIRKGRNSWWIPHYYGTYCDRTHRKIYSRRIFDGEGLPKNELRHWRRQTHLSTSNKIVIWTVRARFFSWFFFLLFNMRNTQYLYIQLYLYTHTITACTNNDFDFVTRPQLWPTKPRYTCVVYIIIMNVIFFITVRPHTYLSVQTLLDRLPFANLNGVQLWSLETNFVFVARVRTIVIVGPQTD